MFDYLKQAEKLGINTQILHNFKGKDILDAQRNFKTEQDKRYFQKQTYEEFLQDPHGEKLNEQLANVNPEIMARVRGQK